MKVVVDFDPVAVRRDWVRTKSGEGIGFIVYIAHEDAAYPGVDWNDYGVSVLGLWLSALIGLWDGTHTNTELWFLDGPYKIYVQLLDDRQSISLVGARGAVSWTARLIDFTEEVLRACETATKRLRELGVDDSVVSPLESGAARLLRLVRP